MSSIHFFYEDISFRLKHIVKLKAWITNTVTLEKQKLSNLNYVFCSDSFLREINVRYLNHDSFTDIITFDVSESGEDSIEGEIYISIERVKDNAEKYKIEFQDELHRVMIHGVLHLLGYADKSTNQKILMRKKEDAYLSLKEF